MAHQARLMEASIPVLAAALLGFTQQEAQTATGSTRTDAFALTYGITQFTTVGSGTGAALPDSKLGAANNDWIFVKNDGSNTLTLYAAGSDTISGTAGATGVSVPAAEGYLVIALNAGSGWIGFPLGT